MSDRIIVTFDKSQEDIPVLMSFRENSFMYFSNSPSITVINTITVMKLLIYGTGLQRQV